MFLLNKLIRIAHQSPNTRAHLVPLIRTVLAAGKSFQDFLDVMHGGELAMVDNPNRDSPIDKVQLRHALKDVPTLHKYQAWYKAWLAKNTEPKEKSSPPKKKGPLPKGVIPKTWDPDVIGADQEHVKHAIDKLSRTLGQPLDSSDLIKLTGVPFIPFEYQPPLRIGASSYSGTISMSVRQEHSDPVESFERLFLIDSYGDPYIENAYFILDNAPKDTGTRTFANQVAEAFDKGFKYLKCTAEQNPPKWNGGVTWPKMGYDGKLPEDPSDDLIAKMEEKGAERPFRISHLMSVEGGPEWWEKNAKTFTGAFDLTEDSYSMKTLQSYVAKKAQAAGVSLEDWMSGNVETPAKKTGSANKNKTRPKNDKHEEIKLEAEDEAIAKAYWKKMQKET